jgi:acetyltransferase
MRTHHLDRLFNPKHIAVIGAGEKPGSGGSAIMKNLLAGYPLNRSGH